MTDNQLYISACKKKARGLALTEEEKLAILEEERRIDKLYRIEEYKRYYERNKEKRREQQKKYAAENREKLRAITNAYYARNRAKIAAQRKARRIAKKINKESV